MRSKFSELIDAGVASFKYSPIAPETPEQDPRIREYNNMWGMATDTHMSIVNGVMTITGSFLSKPGKWMELLYATHWGNMVFLDPCGQPCSLSRWLSDMRHRYRLERVNGDVVIQLFPDPTKDMACEVPDCPKCACTTESKFPQPLRFYLGEGTSKFLDCITESHTLNAICENLNKSPQVPGNLWHIQENTLVGQLGDQTILVELNYKIQE